VVFSRSFIATQYCEVSILRLSDLKLILRRQGRRAELTGISAAEDGASACGARRHAHIDLRKIVNVVKTVRDLGGSMYSDSDEEEGMLYSGGGGGGGGGTGCVDGDEHEDEENGWAGGYMQAAAAATTGAATTTTATSGSHAGDAAGGNSRPHGVHVDTTPGGSVRRLFDERTRRSSSSCAEALQLTGNMKSSFTTMGTTMVEALHNSTSATDTASGDDSLKASSSPSAAAIRKGSISVPWKVGRAQAAAAQGVRSKVEELDVLLMLQQQQQRASGSPAAAVDSVSNSDSRAQLDGVQRQLADLTAKVDMMMRYLMLEKERRTTATAGEEEEVNAEAGGAGGGRGGKKYQEAKKGPSRASFKARSRGGGNAGRGRGRRGGGSSRAPQKAPLRRVDSTRGSQRRMSHERVFGHAN
jgi:hypothetical protein